MTKGEEKRTDRVSMRLPESLAARLERAAIIDRRTKADTTIIALERYLDDFEAANAARIEAYEARHSGVETVRERTRAADRRRKS